MSTSGLPRVSERGLEDRSGKFSRKQARDFRSVAPVEATCLLSGNYSTATLAEYLFDAYIIDAPIRICFDNNAEVMIDNQTAKNLSSVACKFASQLAF